MKSTFLDGQEAKIITSRKVISSVEQGSLLENLGLSTSAAAGALTITLTQSDGSTAPTVSSPTRVAFRSTTIISGAHNVRNFTATETVDIDSGATLGYQNVDDALVFIYSIDDGTNRELAVSSVYKDESLLHTTTTMAATSNTSLLFSNIGRTGAAIRLIGKLQVDAITTAGTWTAPDSLVLNQYGIEMRPQTRFGVISSTETPGTSGDYLAFTGNSVALTPGTWLLIGSGRFTSTPTTAGYTDLQLVFSDSNGDDTSAFPGETALDTGHEARVFGSVSDSDFTRNIQAMKTLTAGAILFLVGQASMATPANARIRVRFEARRIL